VTENKSKTEKLNLGVDIGGTKINSSLISPEGEIIDTIKEPTSKDQTGIKDQIVNHFFQFSQNYSIKNIGIAVAGQVFRDRNTVKTGPNIKWHNYPLATEVKKAIEKNDSESRFADLFVCVENDANAAGFCEYKIGAGKDWDPFVMLTLGTGIGGAIVTNGNLLRGYNGMGAEIGHFNFVPHGALCGCGLKGCYEQYGSGTGTKRIIQEIFDEYLENQEAQVLDRVLAEVDQKRELITGDTVTKLSKEGDLFSIKVLEQVGFNVGYGMGSLTSILDPQGFVIGGGLGANNKDLLLPAIIKGLSANLLAKDFRDFPEIKFAKYDNDAGAIGAGFLADLQ